MALLIRLSAKNRQLSAGAVKRAPPVDPRRCIAEH
jgi:hypothetical protein